jgi:hypothetical protein
MKNGGNALLNQGITGFDPNRTFPLPLLRVAPEQHRLNILTKQPRVGCLSFS